MTNEYKYNLLKYLTNKIDDEVGENTPYFRNKETITNNLKTTLDNMFMQYEFKGQVISPKSDNIVIYGNYDYSSYVGYKKGFIVILNKNCEVLNIITQFNTGTPFSQLITLNVDENGLIYGIDNTGASSGSVRYRFILLNNFLVSNNNEVILRQSYNFPSEYNSMIFSNKCYTHVKKAIGEASYFIVGEKSQSEESSLLEMYLITLTINVGSENEWNAYTNGTGTRFGAKYDFMTSKDDTTNTVTIIHSEENGIYKMYFNGKTVTDTSLSSSETGDCVRMVNDNLFYFANDELNKYDNGTFSIVGRSTYLNLLGTNVISYYYDNSTSGTINIYLGVYDGTNYVEELIYTVQAYYTAVTMLYGYSIYNLYKVCIQIEDNAYTDNIVISSGYNGKSFNDKNSLNPNSVQLYNEDGKIIFARGLYNKTISNNTTEATVEVPNTYLNSDNIAIQDLLSVNNNIMIQSNNLINKNIYETLYINFFNTLRMMNNNDTSSPVINTPGAIRLNNSISNLIDYNNATLTKARINYSDSTNEVVTISYNTVTNARQISLSIYVSKTISSIDFISNDENTIYNTITGNFEIGKTYNIKQLVTVQGVEISLELLYYNNEVVQYNGEDIQIVD